MAVWGTATPAGAQVPPRAPAGFDVSANVRLRYETITGEARAGVPADEASTQLRSMLHASYRAGPLTLSASLFDSRALDAPIPSALSTSEVNAFEPVEAYAALDFGDAARKGLYGRLALGRQTAELQSRRLIANDDFRNTTNGFTGVRLDLADGARWSLTAFYFLPQQRLPDDAAALRKGHAILDREGFDTRLWGATLARPHLLGRIDGDVGVYRLEERDRPGRATRDRRLTTVTARLLAPPATGRFDGEVEFIGQTGSIAANATPGAPRLGVRAWFGHARIGYKWGGGWAPHVMIEADYASGDRRDGTFRRFDTLYGMRRADFAPAGLYSTVSRSNLIAVGPRLEATPWRRADALLTIKKLWLASARDAFGSTGVIDPSGRSGRDAGWQADARVRYWAIPRRLQLEADGVFLAKGQFLADAPNRSTNRDTAYLALNASVFF